MACVGRPLRALEGSALDGTAAKKSKHGRAAAARPCEAASRHNHQLQVRAVAATCRGGVLEGSSLNLVPGAALPSASDTGPSSLASSNRRA
jgi:hypothetical protein